MMSYTARGYVSLAHKIDSWQRAVLGYLKTEK